MMFSLHYLPKEKLIELYKTRWADWVVDPPEWFDAEFRAMIPRELLVEVNPMLWEEARRKWKVKHYYWGIFVVPIYRLSSSIKVMS